MTKKDYELIAASIKASIIDINDFNHSSAQTDATADAMHHLLQNLGTALAVDNEAFSYGKFLKVCGVISE